MKQNNKNGISLIVLVITIVVMIILATVIILSLSGSGIIDNAKEARLESDAASLRDAAIVAYSEYKTGEALGNIEAGVTADKYIAEVLDEAGYTQIDIARIKVDGAAVKVLDLVDGVIIPEGFTASIFTDEDEVAEGLVIYKTDAETLKTKTQAVAQTTFDQFVWVPVTYTKTNTDTNNNRTDDGFDSVFKTTAWSNNAPITGLSSDYIEPYANGYSTEKEEYNEMRKSVEKYGGFYIARYEAGDGKATKERTSSSGTSTVVSRKGAYVYDYVGWGKDMTDAYSEVSSEKGYGAVYLSKNMYTQNNNYTTHLIYGVQWDATLNWLKDKYNVTDHYSWGNYSVTLHECGYSEIWKAKNIYDLAGNALEWTMEADSSAYRVGRGGYKENEDDFYPASNRASIFPNTTRDGWKHFGFRTTLYLN